MTKYRKLPVEIEARKLTVFNGEDIVDWINSSDDVNDAVVTYADAILIPTLEGDMTADLGDYIICGVNGEFYPCKPDIFEKTYEEVESENDE